MNPTTWTFSTTISILITVASPATIAATIAAPIAGTRHSCDTPRFIGKPRVRPPRRAPATDKLTRDGFGEAYQVRKSANFAVKWLGDGVSAKDAQLTLDAVEIAFARYAGEFAQPLPPGAEAYRINVYLSDPHSNPTIDFAGGYAWVDDEGVAYFVMSKELLADAAELQVVAVHELYHDFQFATGAYERPLANWYWEATAEWAAQQMLPDHPYSYMFSGAFALSQELPIFLFDPLATSDIAAVHQYGAALFPSHLDETFGDNIIPRSWTAAPDADPLQVLESLLPEPPLAEVFADFAARNAHWDYSFRDHILRWISVYADFYPDESEVVAVVSSAGTGGFLTLPEKRRIRSFGSAVIEVARPASGVARVDVQLPSGSEGSTASLHATWVDTVGGVPGYWRIPSSPTVAFADLTFADGEAVAHLVVAVVSESRSQDETFDVQYAITPVTLLPQPVPEPDPVVDVSGCSAAGGSPGIALLVGAWWLGLGFTPPGRGGVRRWAGCSVPRSPG